MEKGKRICEYCGLEQDIKAEKCSECGEEFIKTEDNSYHSLDDFDNVDTSKIPTLRELEYDNTNPDLDKRHQPTDSCGNCHYLKGYICGKYNYQIYNSIYDKYKFFICDDFITKAQFKVKKQKELEKKKKTPEYKLKHLRGNVGTLWCRLFFISAFIPGIIQIFDHEEIGVISDAECLRGLLIIIGIPTIISLIYIIYCYTIKKAKLKKVVKEKNE